MAKKIWNIRIEGEGEDRICVVVIKTPNGVQEVRIGSELEALLGELQREHDKYAQREYRHEEHLEQTPVARIPRMLFGKSPEEVLIERYESEKLRDALLCLSEAQRRRFILKYDYRIPTEGIARIEGCSTRAVERSLTNARRKLRRLLEV